MEDTLLVFLSVSINASTEGLKLVITIKQRPTIKHNFDNTFHVSSPIKGFFKYNYVRISSNGIVIEGIR